MIPPDRQLALVGQPISMACGEAVRQVYLITGHVGQEELYQVSLDVLQGPGCFQGGQPA